LAPQHSGYVWSDRRLARAGGISRSLPRRMGVAVLETCRVKHRTSDTTPPSSNDTRRDNSALGVRCWMFPAFATTAAVDSLVRRTVGRTGDDADTLVHRFSLGLAGRVAIPNSPTDPDRVVHRRLRRVIRGRVVFSLARVRRCHVAGTACNAIRLD